MSGLVNFSKYHPGKYLVAWHPKSSEKNERTTIVVENKKVGPILYRQIAGTVARRIVNYAKKNKSLVIYATHDISFAERADKMLKISDKGLV